MRNFEEFARDINRKKKSKDKLTMRDFEEFARILYNNKDM